MAGSKTNTLIIEAKRTPILRISKKWKNISAIDLGVSVIRPLCGSTPVNLTPEHVIMGAVAKPGEYLNPAKESCHRAGWGHINAFTVGKVCSSGLLSIMLGNALIKSGEANCVIAGGMENLLNLSDEELFALLCDKHTGEMTWHAGDWCANTFGITREAQDEWAVESYKRAKSAYTQKIFENELIPCFGQTYDEEPFRNITSDMIHGAAPIYGCSTTTALNSSKNAGGAAAVTLAGQKTAKKYGLVPLAKILGTASVALGGNFRRFTIAPPEAIRVAVANANLSLNQIDLFFINTAFGSVTIYTSRQLGIPLEKINVNGDAVSFGHPIGATGAKLVVEAVWALKNLNKRYAVISLCNAPAEATAMVIKNLKS